MIILCQSCLREKDCTYKGEVTICANQIPILNEQIADLTRQLAEECESKSIILESLAERTTQLAAMTERAEGAEKKWTLCVEYFNRKNSSLPCHPDEEGCATTCAQCVIDCIEKKAIPGTH